ncbi:MAG TPA: amidase [Ktedonobacterales bacterium]
MASEIAALLTRPASELADLIRSGQVTARELVEAALEQAAAQKHLNIFTLLDADAALAAADAIHPTDPRPFAGVPTAIKELNPVAGQRLTMGSALFGDYSPGYDAYAVRRLRAAGSIFIGRTSAPELGILPITEPKRFGPTRNPWDPDRTPGGSSGGAGAAVAAGILPVAHGSDGAGSIRIPAACCGLVGLKPSRGRISRGPDLGDDMLSTDAALTRTVMDSARLLDVMAGYEVGDATWAPAPDEPFAVSAARPPRPLRIAWTVVSPLGGAVDPAASAAVRDAATLLESLGHRVEEATPPEWDATTIIQPFIGLYAASIATGVMYGEQVSRRQATPELVEGVTWGFYQMGRAINAADYAGARAMIQQFARRLIGFFSTYDALLLPSLAQRPLPIGTINVNNTEAMAEFSKAMAFSPFTANWNATGQPAISLPLFHGADGLPLGVQIVGQPLGEGTLLALAAQLEAARPWADRRPTAPAR